MTSPLPHDLVVCIDLNGETVEAGHASFRFRGSAMTTSFAYAPDYLALRQAYSFDPQWFLDIGPHTSEGLPPALADTAPDRWGRSLISRRIRAEAAAASQQARPITELDYLLGVSDVTRQGALRFRTPRGEEYLASATGVPKLVDLAELMAAADTVASDPNDDHATQQALKILLAAGSGTLGGARPKASIQDGDHLYVAKFPHAGDAWNVMAWEQTALDLAAAAGLPVPVRRLVTLDDRHVLLLRRFDRSDASGRLGYVSASTFMGGSSTAARDYLDLVAAIEDHSGDVDGDLEDLYRRIMFSLAINNTDDHMRNTAFLYTTNGWRLSPSTTSTQIHRWGGPGQHQYSDILLAHPEWRLSEETPRTSGYRYPVPSRSLRRSSPQRRHGVRLLRTTALPRRVLNCSGRYSTGPPNSP